ncbi:hypothetical protein ACFVP8_12955 [Viridibacillus arvi]|uniref:hypothetical protein n=1 Tax=Viridibacillus arvi TaxID=263475 RepID=UPI00369124EC
MNKNKIYTYQKNGDKVSIEYTKTDKGGFRFWHIIGEPNYSGFKERQNKNGYSFYSSSGPYEKPLAVTNNPKKGKKYINKTGYIEQYDSYIVLSTDATVKTKYKTFKNCMVLKYVFELNGSPIFYSYDYYAPNYGLIKSVIKTEKGSAADWELISVKNKKK